MSKVKQYIEDAVKAAVDEIKTKGVEVSNCNFDMNEHIHVDNGDLSDVLLQLAIAQQKIADAAVSISKSKPKIENKSTGLSFHGIDNRPMKFDEK